jgi:hypothetical protein
MSDSAFCKEWRDGFDGLSSVFITFVCPEIDELGTGLALDKSEPIFEHL